MAVSYNDPLYSVSISMKDQEDKSVTRTITALNVEPPGGTGDGATPYLLDSFARAYNTLVGGVWVKCQLIAKRDLINS